MAFIVRKAIVFYALCMFEKKKEGRNKSRLVRLIFANICKFSINFWLFIISILCFQFINFLYIKETSFKRCSNEYFHKYAKCVALFEIATINSVD